MVTALHVPGQKMLELSAGLSAYWGARMQRGYSIALARETSPLLDAAPASLGQLVALSLVVGLLGMTAQSTAIALEVPKP